METSQFPAPLSPYWAFVVQLCQGSGFTPNTLHGRVEHFVSRRATTFSALAELLTFMKCTLLSHGHPEPCEASTKTGSCRAEEARHSVP